MAANVSYWLLTFITATNGKLMNLTFYNLLVLTNTITSAISEMVPTKSIKQNPIGLPIEIRELTCQKRYQRRLWQRNRIPQYKTNTNYLQKRISKDITIRKRDNWKMYCEDMELSEGQDAAWCKICFI